jgi:AcrR family transcriptional regulator
MPDRKKKAGMKKALPRQRQTDPKRIKRKYNGPKREEQKQATLARILDSALKLFSQKGFYGAALRDISANAGVTHAVIRLHFGGKKELWRAAVDHLFEKMAAEMRLAPDEPAMNDGVEGFASFLRRYVRYCARHPEHARLMLQESMRPNKLLLYAVEKHIAPSHKFVESVVKSSLKDGVVVNIPAISFVYIIAAAGQTIFALSEEAKAIYGIDVFDESFIDQHAEAVVKLLVRP